MKEKSNKPTNLRLLKNWF